MQQILKVVGYDDEPANERTNELLSTIFSYSLTYAVSALPPDRVAQIEASITPELSLEEKMKIIIKGIGNPNIYFTALESAAEDVMHGYFTAIGSSLTPEQRTQITTLIEDLAKKEVSDKEA